LTGRHQHGSFLRMGVSESPDSVTRAAVVVSRRVGTAVVRNRVKRRLREIYRLQRPLLKKHLLLVVTAKPAAATASSQSLLAEWLRLAGRLSIFSAS
jgi:ribonuclease P protein component